MKIPFGPWLPDQADLDNPGVTEALNVLPAANSYLPWRAQQPYSTTPIDVRATGGIQARAADASVSLYVGDAGKLYELDGLAWIDRSKPGGYALDKEERWEMIKWGETVIACGGVNGAATNNIQTIGLNQTQFDDLIDPIANPEEIQVQARHIAVVRDQVVIGNTSDPTDGPRPNRVWWSGIGNPTIWRGGDPVTQSDFQDIQGEGGWVQKVVGGEYGVIIQERAIWRMSYVGAPVIYQFDRVLSGRGTPAPGSVVHVGRHVFFLSQDGFAALTDGSSLQDIGAEKVDRTFFQDFDPAFYNRITSTFDPVNQRVYWAYPGAGNTDGRPNQVLCYDWSLDRWSRSEQEIELLYVAGTVGYTLEGLDALSQSVPPQGASPPPYVTPTDPTAGIDGLTESLDSRAYVGGATEVGIMDKDNQLAFWSGAPLPGRIDTAERQLSGERTRVTELRPLVTGGDVTVQIGTRASVVGDPVTWTPEAAPNVRGRVTRRSNARYHRFRTNVSGAFSDALGIDVDAVNAGRR